MWMKIKVERSLNTFHNLTAHGALTLYPLPYLHPPIYSNSIHFNPSTLASAPSLYWNYPIEYQQLLWLYPMNSFNYILFYFFSHYIVPHSWNLNFCATEVHSSLSAHSLFLFLSTFLFLFLSVGYPWGFPLVFSFYSAFLGYAAQSYCFLECTDDF